MQAAASKPLIAMTMGDPAGIGPELCLKAVADPDVLAVCRPVIVGDASVLRQVAQRLSLAMPGRVMTARQGQDAEALEALKGAAVIDVGAFTGSVQPGESTAQGGAASFAYINYAIDGALERRFGAITTAPITKATLQMAGVEHPGHTEILAQRTGVKNYAMMLYSSKMAVSLVTIHQSLASVPGALNLDDITRIALLTEKVLHRLRGRKPRLAILGLNPHAGEHGMFGREEIEIIGPAVEKLQRNGIDAEGPLPPDAAFMPHALERFDGHVAMYHDQGLIPFKMAAMHEGVNITMGLPIVRTSPDHGTAYDIAWKGKADPSSMVTATKLAASLAH